MCIYAYTYIHMNIDMPIYICADSSSQLDVDASAAGDELLCCMSDADACSAFQGAPVQHWLPRASTTHLAKASSLNHVLGGPELV